MRNDKILEAMEIADNFKSPDAVQAISAEAHVNAGDTVGSPAFGRQYSDEYLRIWKGTVEGVLIDRNNEHATEFFANLGIKI